MAESRRSEILLVFALALGAYLAYTLRNVLLLIYVSMIFAIVLTPAVNAVRRIQIGDWNPGKALAMVTVLALIFGSLIFFFWVALPPIFRDLTGLAREWPEKIEQLSQRIQGTTWGADFEMPTLREWAAETIPTALRFITGFVGGLFGFFSGLILMVYFMLDGKRAFLWFLSLFPAGRRHKLDTTMRRANIRVRNWLIGQALLMLVLGSLATLGFWLLGLKYFYALGVFTGLANIVPILGPVIALIFVSIVALLDAPIKVLGVVGFFILYQQLENGYLTPRIMRTTVNLPALAIVIALAIGGNLAGVFGALMAVPTAAIAAVFIEEYLVHDDAYAERELEALEVSSERAPPLV